VKAKQTDTHTFTDTHTQKHTLNRVSGKRMKTMRSWFMLKKL